MPKEVRFGAFVREISVRQNRVSYSDLVTLTSLFPILGVELLAVYLAQTTSPEAIMAANVRHARGAGRHSPLAHRRVGETPEQDVLTVLVPAAQAEALFASLYEHSGVSQSHGGLMYMQALSGATPFSLPELPEEA